MHRGFFSTISNRLKKDRFRGLFVRDARQAGLTMIELLIVLAILAILLVLLFMMLSKTQIARSQDVVRKADLEAIRISFEDYHNDKGCYPPSDVLNDCKGISFQPYLEEIPCDPVSGDPYLYVPLDSNACNGYRVYTELSYTEDPVIEALHCDTPVGCGYGATYNYGISAGVPVADQEAISATPTPGVTPSPSPSPSNPIYLYACDNNGICNRYEYGHPFLEQCPITFEASNCNNECDNPANYCNE